MPDRVLTSGMHDGSGQSSDPLLTDHLATLLRQFPNGDRHKIVAVLREHTSWSPFSASRAAAAHAVKPGGDLYPHVDAIASEILWWGSNEFHRMFGEERTWPDVLSDVAKSMGVSSDDCVAASGACGIERALLKKAFEHWESLKPEQREEALRKAGINLNPARGGVGAAFGAAGMAARMAAPELLALIIGEGAVVTFAAAILAPIAAAIGTVWAAYDLAGPSHRVLRPVALIIACTRQRLRDQRAADAFQD